jgi:DNA-binding transcriptional LysR family regulator
MGPVADDYFAEDQNEPRKRPVVDDFYASPVDLGSLAHALEVGEHLSFRRAAATLGVQQSAVSQRIRRLEDYLGVSLFERHSRGVRVTTAGDRFLRQVRTLFGQLDLAIDGARAAGRGEQGELRIGLLTSLSGGFLSGLIRRYASDHPNVRIGWREGARRTLINEVRSHRLDVAFIMGDGAINECDTEELWRERLHIALPRDHQLATRDSLGWVDLLGERFIFSEDPAGVELHDHVVACAVQPDRPARIEREAVSQETLLNLVALGYGISLVLDGSTAAAPAETVLRPLTDDRDAVRFRAVWSPSTDNPALRRFLSTARLMSGAMKRASGKAVASDRMSG